VWQGEDEFATQLNVNCDLRRAAFAFWLLERFMAEHRDVLGWIPASPALAGGV
jgi:hypothetical protein